MIRSKFTPFNRYGKYVRVVLVDTTEVRDEIVDSRVQSFLKFNTSLGGGKHYVHIVSQSAFPVETGRHVITQGETLCARRLDTIPLWSNPRQGEGATCPGCLAIAKGIAARDMSDTELLAVLRG